MLREPSLTTHWWPCHREFEFFNSAAYFGGPETQTAYCLSFLAIDWFIVRVFVITAFSSPPKMKITAQT